MSKKPTASQLLDEMFSLYSELVLPYMKIERDMPFPDKPGRRETDGEHSYTLAMIGMALSERMKLGLDTGLIAKYALIHDLVEVHAGDVSVRASKEELATKTDREHEAFLLIKERFLDHAPWIAELIEAYEARADEESKFVYSCDKIMGAFVRISGDGYEWTKAYPDADGTSYHTVVKRLRAKAETYPPLLDIFDEVHSMLDKQRAVYHERDQASS